MLKKLSLTLVALAFSASSFAELTVIVNPSNASKIDNKQVQRIFLGKDKKFPDGSEAIPVNLTQDNANRAIFDESLLERSSSQVSAYWAKLVFTGKGIPPKEVSTDADVIALVSANPNVIGYVDSSSVNDSVKIVSQ